MKAIDLDKDIECPICSGKGDEPDDADAFGGVCPRCDGVGTINRYRDGDDHEIVLAEEYVFTGNVVVFTIERADRERFDAEFGDLELITTDSSTYQDTIDQMGNESLGTNTNANGVYELPDGRTVSPDDFPNNEWPSSPELTPDEVVAWHRARGNKHGAKVFEQLRGELEL